MSLSKLKPSQLWDKDRTCHEYKDIGDIDNITMKCEFPVIYGILFPPNQECLFFPKGTDTSAQTELLQ